MLGAYKNTRRHGKKCTSVYIFYLRVCDANTLLIRTTDIRGGTEIPFENRRCRYKARTKINRRHVEKRTSLYAFQRQVFLAKNLLLFRTTDILVRSDTLSIFRSGTDATGSTRSDISAKPKFAIKSVHGCTLLMMQRSICTVYFKRC